MKRLTDARVAALTMPPGKTDHYEWDDARELAVRLRKRGPKSKLAMKWYKGGNVGGRPSEVDLSRHIEVARLIPELGRVGVVGLDPEKRQLGLDPLLAQRPDGGDRDILALVAIHGADQHEPDRIGDA